MKIKNHVKMHYLEKINRYFFLTLFIVGVQTFPAHASTNNGSDAVSCQGKSNTDASACLRSVPTTEGGASARSVASSMAGSLAMMLNLILDDDEFPPAEGQGGMIGNEDGLATPRGVKPVVVNLNPPHLDSSNAGTLPGTMTVDKNGFSNYSIPIEVPPGSAGLEPSLSLAYSSGGGNGMVGLGWSLQGLSTIHRCAKTIAQDGYAGRITLTNEDRLCLDGKRLININKVGSSFDVNDTYWADDAEYRTELDSFKRIRRAYGGAFVVDMGDGRMFGYGSILQSGSGRIYAPGETYGRTVFWALDSIVDQSSNYLQINYSHDDTTGEYLPTQIVYGGNVNSNQLPDIAVKFQYETRDDAQPMYIGGVRNDMRMRLSGISTYVSTNADGSGGKLARTYTLNYGISESSGRSLMSTIQSCAINPVSSLSECLPATKFDWGRGGALSLENLPGAPITLPVPAIKEYLSQTSWNDLGSGRLSRYQANIDGSGRTSLIAYFNNSKSKAHARNYLLIRLPDGREITPAIDTAAAGFGTEPIDIRELSWGDLDGDGRDDLVIVANYNNKQSWAYCLNVESTQVTIQLVCKPGAFTRSDSVFEQLVDSQNDRKMHVFSYFAGGSAEDCALVSTSMVCKTVSLASAGGLGIARPVVLARKIEGVDLSGRGMTDFLIKWTHLIPAANPKAAYNFTQGNNYFDSGPKDLSMGIATCVNERGSFHCKPLLDLTVPGNGFYLDKLVPVGDAVRKILVGDSVGDLNGDGLTDFVYSVSLTGNKEVSDSYICYSTEVGTDCRSTGIPKMTSPAVFPSWGMTGDFYGDGVNRMFVTPLDAKEGRLCRFIDSQLVCEKLPATGGGLPSPVFLDYSGVPSFLIGRYVPPTHNPYSYNEEVVSTLTPTTFAKPAAVDKIVSVTNGYGLTEELNYARGNDEAVYRRFAVIDGVERRPTYPQSAIAPPVMVKALRRDNGQGNWVTSTYYYEGAMVDAHGRGSLGFSKILVTDEQTGTQTTSLLSQQYPFVGALLRSETVSAQGITLSLKTFTPDQKTFKHKNSAQTIFTYAAKIKEERRDLDGSALNVTQSEKFYEDGWGNVTEERISTVAAGKEFTVKTVSGYRNDEERWLVGLVTSRTTSKGYTGARIATLSAIYDYEQNTGYLKSETLEPNSPDFKVNNSYQRGNPFGLVDSVKQTWRDPNSISAAERSRTLRTIAYDGRGRFVESLKNALGQKQSFTFDKSTGALRSSTDANMLVTNWENDGFGRRTMEVRPDGNGVNYYLKQCVSGCPDWAAVVAIADPFHKNISGGRSGIEGRTAPPSLIYRDRAGHSISMQTWGFDGRIVAVDTVYDHLGRIKETYRPRYEGDPSFLRDRRLYDALDRVIEVQSNSETGGILSSTARYSGLQRVTKNAKGQVRTETLDGFGRIVKVDDSLRVTEMEYDAFGNLSRTTDPNGNVITIDYDDIGRKRRLNDPDLGRIDYTLDPLGRTYRQTSPRQRASGTSTVLIYDDLDRLVGREEDDLLSYWTFDSAKNGIGQLAEAYTLAGKNGSRDYRRVHKFDQWGRAAGTEQLIDGTWFNSSVEYDEWGREIVQLQQRQGNPGKRFGVRYNSYGYADQVEREGRIVWRAEAMDAAFHLTKATLGNRLRLNDIYDPFTGNNSSSTVSTAENILLLQEGYEYDGLDNVTKRSQHWSTGGYIEDFNYDELNRLKTSKIQGQPLQEFTYDNAGNLKSKTGVGTYTYPVQGVSAVRPHGVTDVAGSAYLYDDNGNVKSGGGRTFTWTSFDMPSRITAAEASASFVYGPEHQRVRQVRSDGSKTVYTDGQEVETTVAGAIVVRTYWPHGVGFEIDRVGTGAQTELYWSHTDRLGSPVAITGSSGQLVEKLAYDAWGNRREGGPGVRGGGRDNKGYTGHEMLDQLGLVHMNGRVFDPVLARFLSGDALVQDVTNGQNYNRYSYVLNNPINLTDPTGFAYDGGNGTPSPGTTVDIIGPRDGSNTCGYSGCGMDRISPVTPGGQNNAADRGNSRSPSNNAEAIYEFSSKVDAAFPNQVTLIAKKKKAKVNYADQEMLHIIEFDLLEALARSAGASERQLYWLTVAQMVGNPKSLLKLGIKNPKAIARLNPCQCFIEGTLVLTSAGLTPIEKIQVGDLVAARDDLTGATDWKPVLHLVRNMESEFVHVAFRNQSGAIEKIIVTPGHPFMVLENGWVEAVDLEVGHKIQNYSGGIVVVESLEYTRGSRYTYNFEVDEFNTYFVGSSSLWVHNACNISNRIKSGVLSKEYVVYQGVGKDFVKYIGITSRSALERFNEHAKSFGTGKENLQFSVIPGLEGLTKMQARIEEQRLIIMHGFQREGGTLLNRINSIAEKYWDIHGIEK